MKGIEGSTLGRYELHYRIAQGGMSEVYLGYDPKVRRRVAVKVLYGSDEVFVRRFEREALAVGALSHDHILPLYDFGTQRPWYYLVMPYVAGGTLRDYLQELAVLSLEEAGSFLEQIASALQYAHEHGVVHRDVKPSNILLRPDGHAYLGDFGLAKAKMEAEAVSHSGIMIGTPEYMAPEQSNGQYDYRSDIYSLGIILYQMLTGTLPFTADSPVAISLKHIQSRPTPPHELNSAIPLSIEAVLLIALAKQPGERYQEANAFAKAYHTALQQTLAASESYHTVSLQESGSYQTALLDELPSADEYSRLSASQKLAALTTNPRLIPLKTQTADLPSLKPLQRSQQRRRHLLLLVAALTATMLFALPTSVFLFTRTPHTQLTPIATTVKATRDTSIPRKATQTAVAHKNAQAILAAQARVQATAGITTALGEKSRFVYGSDMLAPTAGWINDGRQCSFSSDGYHIATTGAYVAAWCYSNQQSFKDVMITAQVRLLHGDVCGLIFRLRPGSKEFYIFQLNWKGQYRLVRALGNDPFRWLVLVDWTSSTAIHRGYGHLNTILAITSGSTFRFYINKQLVLPSFQDHAYSYGLIGLFVGGDSEGGTEAVFKNVWVLEN